MHGGYREIQSPPKRYAIVDLAVLTALCGFASIDAFQEAHRQWVDTGAQTSTRDECWSTSLAVGNPDYLERVQSALRGRASHRRVSGGKGDYSLRESQQPYWAQFGPEKALLSPHNTRFWRQSDNATSI
jgi:hypothetical protein